MSKTSFILRRLSKSKSLRLINWASLSVIFACILASYAYIKHELSYDRFYTNADRIVRMTVAFDGGDTDGRFYGTIGDILDGIPEIEKELKLSKIHTSILKYNGVKHIVPDLYIASTNLPDLLDIPLIDGDFRTVIDSPRSIIISKSFAQALFGRIDMVGKSVSISSRMFDEGDATIQAIFEDMPSNTHFHTDMILISQNYHDYAFYYLYLLLVEGCDLKELERNLSNRYHEAYPEYEQIDIQLMPMTDIHLHSRVLREMEPNGNISYIYLVTGFNILLLIIVLFNLWLNSSVISSYNKRYYRLLRLNGASPTDVLKDESKVALVMSVVSIITGKLLNLFVGSYFAIPSGISSSTEEITITLLFLFFTIFISLLPVLIQLSSTLFFNRETNEEHKKSRLSISEIKYMLITRCRQGVKTNIL